MEAISSPCRKIWASRNVLEPSWGRDGTEYYRNHVKTWLTLPENENIKYISKAKQEFVNFTGGSDSIETVDFSLIRAINKNIIVMDRIVIDDENSSSLHLLLTKLLGVS